MTIHEYIQLHFSEHFAVHVCKLCKVKTWTQTVKTLHFYEVNVHYFMANRSQDLMAPSPLCPATCEETIPFMVHSE